MVRRKQLVVPIPNAPEIVRLLWEQKDLPVIYRPDEGKLIVKLPYKDDNRRWMRQKGSHQPEYHREGQYWITPHAWYDRLVRKSLVRYGGVYTIRPVHKKRVCAPACWDAFGPDCHCSCEGKNHGKRVDARRWNVINETFAIEWGPKELRCTLLLPTGATPLEGEVPVDSVKPPGIISRYADRRLPARG